MSHHPFHGEAAASIVADLDVAADTVRRWLEDADRVLIGAGAGLSAAAGYDYGDTTRFAELFPALHRRGLRARYQLIGLPLPPDLLWGYWATHLHDIRFSAGPHPVYQQLRALIGDRDHFVMTSNVDALFVRNGFAPDRVFTMQGDYGRYQCETPCTRDTWPSRPIIDRALNAYDAATGKITDPEAVPTCPNCGGTVFLNVNKGPEYIADPYLPTGHLLEAWLRSAPASERLLLLDIGSGYNTPGVIRWPMEALTRARPNGHLIRINTHHPEVLAELRDRSVSTSVSAAALLASLTAT